MEEPKMTDDPRCCGSGTCIIDTDGRCWCGQRWDGEKMAPPRRAGEAADAANPSAAETAGETGGEGTA